MPVDLADSAISVSHQTVKDLDLVTIATAELSAVLLPRVGGRLISLSKNGREMLWRNPAYLDSEMRVMRPRTDWPAPDGTMGSWVNLGGSKTWLAPQGWDSPDCWAGPPDPVLDGGPYETVVTTNDHHSEVVLTSGVDPVTGMQITRSLQFSAGEAVIRQTSAITNRGRAPVSWAAWDVTQVDTSSMATTCPSGSGVYVFDSGAAAPLDLLEVTGCAHRETAGVGIIRVPVQPVVAKLGFPSASGVLRFVRPDGYGLQISFRREPDARYPDGGCPVELWLQHPLPEPLAEFGGLHPEAHLVELEVLSPVTDLLPGEQCSLATQWTVFGPSTRQATQA